MNTPTLARKPKIVRIIRKMYIAANITPKLKVIIAPIK
uniref:Uncharacterized protein n=1 Tax=Schistosoma japonicum TaxID=6182 RepID=Q5BY28_SCHJA|nr:unknown [Schistosoma japonicum]